jgi:hypothetical protein
MLRSLSANSDKGKIQSQLFWHLTKKILKIISELGFSFLLTTTAGFSQQSRNRGAARGWKENKIIGRRRILQLFSSDFKQQWYYIHHHHLWAWTICELSVCTVPNSAPGKKYFLLCFTFFHRFSNQ